MYINETNRCKYQKQRGHAHFGFHFLIFDLKDSKDELILIVLGTLFLILSATKSFLISSIWSKLEYSWTLNFSFVKWKRFLVFSWRMMCSQRVWIINPLGYFMVAGKLVLNISGIKNLYQKTLIKFRFKDCFHHSSTFIQSYKIESALIFFFTLLQVESESMMISKGFWNPWGDIFQQ